MPSAIAKPPVNNPNPQSFISSYAPRLRSYGNALISPVIEKATQLSLTRTTKRGTTAINYAEDGYDDDDFDDSEGPRMRPTGLRSLRRDEASYSGNPLAVLGREVDRPVDVQGVWRDWMGKPSKVITERQHQIQTALPLTLIPIRIDLDLPPFRPEAALPLPENYRALGIDETNPAYRPGEPTPTYRLKDAFLWNLHEALITPDQFAKKFVEELDLPADRRLPVIMQITNQIRQQLEDYAGVALHPLFHSTSTNTPHTQAATSGISPAPLHPSSSSRPNGISSHHNLNQDPSTTLTATPTTNSTPAPDSIRATATAAGPKPNHSLPITSSAAAAAAADDDDTHNPDDTYRCIVALNVNLLNRLYSDRFEWSLLHPPGHAEHFARQTCADLGLAGEWVSAIAHAIYEAVLRLKKEVCENGGLLLGYGDMANDAADGEAGWRYAPDDLAEEWEPKLELLNKEEIEKREGDRERQLRRMRRETARFSSTTNMAGSLAAAERRVGEFEREEEQPMGRGERSKKKRRFRSLSPVGRDTPETVAGYGGGLALQDHERQTWRCAHCSVWGSAVWAVRDGPAGPKSLCHNCGFLYERDKKLPPWNLGLFAGEFSQGSASARR